MPFLAACDGEPAFSRLDFWLGEWDVFVGTDVVGTNRIARVLGGCAIFEQWTAAGGGAGHSLFYVHPSDRRWRQVWVTTQALAPGGVKEKAEVDRTTLTPNPDGGVRMVGDDHSHGRTDRDLGDRDAHRSDREHPPSRWLVVGRRRRLRVFRGGTLGARANDGRH
jgi:hypothetical protein